MSTVGFGRLLDQVLTRSARYLARGTVKAHLASMYTKIGVSNRTQAAIKAPQGWTSAHAAQAHLS